MTASLKKVEDEVDKPETTIEELVEVSLDNNDPEEKSASGCPIEEGGKRIDGVPLEKQRRVCLVPQRHTWNKPQRSQTLS